MRELHPGDLINRRSLYLIVSTLVVIGIIALIAIKGPLAPVTVQSTQLTQGPTRTGTLKQLLIDHGDMVQAGQLPGEMDPVDLTDRLQSAQLSVEKYEHLVGSRTGTRR